MKTLMSLSKLSFAALALAVTTSQAAVTTLTIDNFQDRLPVGTSAAGDLLVDASTTMATSTQLLTVPDIAGTSRTITLEFISGGTTATASTEIVPGRLSYSAGPGVGPLPATTAILSTEYTFLSALDFTGGGGDSIGIDIYSRDTAVDANIVATVTSSTGTDSVTVPFTLAGTTQMIPFTDFSGVDFTQVDKLEIKIDPNPAFDGSIRLLGITSETAGVPEPSGSIAFLAILAGVVARRRRA